MTPALGNRPLVHLHPGELLCGTRDVVITTILGSCVTAILRWPRQGHWAATHSILPRPDSASAGDAPRFTDTSIEAAFAYLVRHGATPEQMEVKLFGGADALSRDPAYGMGERNVQAALRALADLGITPRVKDVGGRHGRKLLFRTAEGDVYVRRLGGRR